MDPERETDAGGDETFALEREPQRRRTPRPARVENFGGEQRVLFAGLDCLAGQRDLFETEGEGLQ